MQQDSARLRHLQALRLEATRLHLRPPRTLPLHTAAGACPTTFSLPSVACLDGVGGSDAQRAQHAQRQRAGRQVLLISKQEGRLQAVKDDWGVGESLRGRRRRRREEEWGRSAAAAALPSTGPGVLGVHAPWVASGVAGAAGVVAAASTPCSAPNQQSAPTLPAHTARRHRHTHTSCRRDPALTLGAPSPASAAAAPPHGRGGRG